MGETVRPGALVASYLTAGMGLVLVGRQRETETTVGCLAVCEVCGWTHKQEHSLDQAERFEDEELFTAEQVLEQCDANEIAAARDELRQSSKAVAMDKANAHAGTCRMIPEGKWAAFGVIAAFREMTELTS